MPVVTAYRIVVAVQLWPVYPSYRSGRGIRCLWGRGTSLGELCDPRLDVIVV